MGRSKKRSRLLSQSTSGLPKGAYRHPDGGIVLPDGTRERTVQTDLGNSLSVRGVKRDNPEMKRLARALIDVAKEVADKKLRDDREKQ